jgi:hypothetical protein
MWHTQPFGLYHLIVALLQLTWAQSFLNVLQVPSLSAQ